MVDRNTKDIESNGIFNKDLPENIRKSYLYWIVKLKHGHK